MHIGYIFLKIFTKPLSLLPLGFHRTMGKVIGVLAEKVAGYRRDTVMINLSRSFPEKKYDELNDIRHRFYRHFGTIFCEAIWFGSATRARIRRTRIVTLDNPGLLNDLYTRYGNVFILTSHLGNWELMGSLKASAVDEPLLIPENDLTVVYKELSSKAWGEFFFHNRIAPLEDKEHYDGMIESVGAMRYAFAHRHDKKFYILITDQYPYSWKESIPLEEKFLSQDTVTMAAGAAFAKIFSMPVVYMGMKEKEEGGYVLHCETICENASEMDKTEIMQEYYRRLEKDIREQPWAYLWSHRRWK